VRMRSWSAVRTLVVRYTGIALALWGLPLGVAAARIALSQRPQNGATIAITILGLIPAAGMLFVGLLGLVLIAYSAGWLRVRR